MEHNNEIKRIFKLYLEGQSNREQEEILFRYLNVHPGADKELYELIEDSWISESPVPDDPYTNQEDLTQLWLTIDERKQKKAQRYQLLKYAASLVLICSAVLMWLNQRNHPGAVKTIALLSKTTAPGEKVKMILPDSSVVYLGSRSKLMWPEKFVKGKKRNIRLEGEAFFEVKRDTASPFVIQSGNMETRVLGTSFNIYAYPGDKAFTVAVRTGRVAVSKQTVEGIKKLSLLTPGMKLVFQQATGNFVINNEQIADVNSWTANRFIFKDESLEAMLIKLERYYRIRIELKNPEMAACRFNATFNNKNIIEVMQQLRVMSGGHIKYRINDDKTTIALWGKVCQ